MKQNSYIMFHSTFNSLMRRYLGALLQMAAIAFLSLSLVDALAADPFDSAKGFKPAQRDLTEIYLQLAESLKVYGSPIPYLKHVRSEHDRIAALYRQKFGKAPVDYCPAGMTDEFIKRVSANWDALAPDLALEPMTKDIGRLIVESIKGSQSTNTVIVSVLNRHQRLVLEGMGKGTPVSFKALQSALYNELEWDKEIVRRVSLDKQKEDAQVASRAIQRAFTKLFAALDKGLPADEAANVKSALVSTFVNTGMMAESELKAGIMEWALNPAIEQWELLRLRAIAPKVKLG